MHTSNYALTIQAQERIQDMHRDAAAIRLEREARQAAKPAATRNFNPFNLLNRLLAATPQPAPEGVVRKPVARRV